MISRFSFRFVKFSGGFNRISGKSSGVSGGYLRDLQRFRCISKGFMWLQGFYESSSEVAKGYQGISVDFKGFAEVQE